MIVDDLRIEERGEGVERSARLRWGGGEARLRVRGPADWMAPAEDASPYLAAAIQLAMRRAEDLDVEGTVSPRLLARAERIQATYARWNPELPRTQVRAAAAARSPVPGERAAAAFFSRGVDSTHSAVAPRPEGEALDMLVFADGLELRHDAAVRDEEVRLAEAAADAAGRPLCVVATNVRELSEPLCDWEDMAGAGLAFLALSLAGGLRRAVIPATDTAMSLMPCGTSPLLDPLFSTEDVAVEHDRLDLTRHEKVAWLAEHHPELLPFLKVCFAENRPDNCGRCAKCLLTMAALVAAGALERASGFPDRIDLAALDVVRMDATSLNARYDVAEAARALPRDGAAGEVRAALLARLADLGRWVDTEAPAPSPPITTFRTHHGRSVLSLIRDGRPYPPVAGDAGRARAGCSSSLGLIRALAPDAGSHVYGLGAPPPGQFVGELGAAADAPPPDPVAVWLSADGRRLETERAPAPARPRTARLARWTLAPLTWRDSGLAMSVRARTAAWRARRLLGGRRAVGPGAALTRDAPAYLHRDSREDRLALYASVHPVTGDQLLSTSEWEGSDMGYVETVRLGYLDALAPVTGRLGTGRPRLPWASRLGQAAR